MAQNNNLRLAINTLTKNKDISVVVFMFTLLAIIFVPLPAMALDIFLALSISLSVLILLISMYIPKPTDFTTLPTIILVITLFRLALNIATTRMILGHGHEGPQAVSSIITSFGNFVVGGNYIIGLIVFIILVLINFMVVTKGSGRVAEVAARFTLDSMPGKQMAIDADLNAGLIEQSEAKARRTEIISEANFYGAMDGGSKFVKGDAIAGIIITIINILGGITIGAFSFDLSISEAAATYTMLTIGDGLVSQVPALIVSTATGIIITRSSASGSNLAQESINQLGDDSKVLWIVGGIMVLFALVPGLPTIPMGIMGMAFLGMAFLMTKEQEQKSQLSQEQEITAKQEPVSEAAAKEQEMNALNDILRQEPIEIAFGYGLIPLVDPYQDGELLNRIKQTRTAVAKSFGFLMPEIRMKDDLRLDPNQYKIFINGLESGTGIVIVDRLLALAGTHASGDLEGIDGVDPVYNMKAIWITKDKKDDAITQGYSPVEPPAIIQTHIQNVIEKNAAALLTRQNVRNLIDKLKEDHAILVETVGKNENLAFIQKVLQQMLEEGLSIHNLANILEIIDDNLRLDNPNVCSTYEHIRIKMGKFITRSYLSADGKFNGVLLNSKTVKSLVDKLHPLPNGGFDLLIDQTQQHKIIDGITEALTPLVSQGISPIALLVTNQDVRKPLADFIKHSPIQNKFPVISTNELDTDFDFNIHDELNLNLDE